MLRVCVCVYVCMSMDQCVQEAINTHRHGNIHKHTPCMYSPLPWRRQHGVGVRGAEAAGAATQGGDHRLSFGLWMVCQRAQSVDVSVVVDAVRSGEQRLKRSIDTSAPALSLLCKTLLTLITSHRPCAAARHKTPTSSRCPGPTPSVTSRPPPPPSSSDGCGLGLSLLLMPPPSAGGGGGRGGGGSWPLPLPPSILPSGVDSIDPIVRQVVGETCGSAMGH